MWWKRMIKNKLPDSLTKRRLLYERKDTDYVLYGDLFFRHQHYNDALDFFEKGHHMEGLLKIKEVALQNGNAYLAERLTKCVPDIMTNPDWEQIFNRATGLGKGTYAHWAKEKIKT